MSAWSFLSVKQTTSAFVASELAQKAQSAKTGKSSLLMAESCLGQSQKYGNH